VHGLRPPIDLRRFVAGVMRVAPDVAIVGEVRDREALPGRLRSRLPSNRLHRLPSHAAWRPAVRESATSTAPKTEEAVP
jgi:hypothetical protein